MIYDAEIALWIMYGFGVLTGFGIGWWASHAFHRYAAKRDASAGL